MKSSLPESLILDSLGEGVFTVDADFRIRTFNRAAERITGISREEALGMRCRDVFRADICQSRCALRRTLESGERLEDVPVTILDREMEERPVRVSTAVLRNEDGEVVGGVEVFRDVSELEALRRALREETVFQDMVGVSRPMRELFRLIPDVARAPVSVVIQGPSGTGKEMVAAALHELSPRREAPFVRINCAALPDSLLESELFGHEQGAFTDARKAHQGAFVQAHGGTLLLDEIGDTSPAFQVKLLRALEEGEIRPLGATRSVKVDVRVLAATHRDLTAEVEAGRFRQDLYYRLRVVSLVIPPLAERREDIPPLVEQLLGMAALRLGITPPKVSAGFLDALARYPFPGNVRELRNLIERALVVCHCEELLPAHLPPEVLDAASASGRPGPRKAAPPKLSADPQVRALVQALEAHGWNRAETAKALGIGRTTLWRRMKKAGMV